MSLSLCNLINEEHRGEQLKRFNCDRCGLLTPWLPINSTRIVRVCVVPGVGGCLKDLLHRLGGRLSQGCGCEEMAHRMDEWGPAGCREHRAEIITQLEESARKLGWWETVTIGNALRKQPWFKILDPAGSMVDEAIRRAEANLAVA